MSYNSFLPAELMYLFRELPSEILGLLDLETYTLKNNSLKQICQDIAHQLEKILEQEQPTGTKTDRQQPIVRRIYHCTLAMSDQWEKLYKIVSQPNNVFEAIWRVSSYGQVSKNDIDFFDRSLVTSETATHSIITDVLHQYSTGSGETTDPQVWLNKFLKIQDNDPAFINNHFIEISFLLRVLSIPLGIIGDCLPFYRSMHYQAKIRNMQGIVAMYKISIGTILITASQHTKALEYYDQALPIIENIGWEMKKALLNNKGIILMDLARYDEAEEIYRDLVSTSDNRSYNYNLAEVLKIKNNYEEAFQYAMRNFVEPEDSFFVMPYDQLHEIYLETGKVDKAKEMENLAKQVCELRPIPPNKINVEIMYGRRHHHLGNLSLAKEYYQKALDFSLQLNNLRGIFNLYSHLIGVQTDLYALRSDNEQIRNQLYSLINSILQLSDEQGLVVASIELLQLRAEAFVQDEMFEEAREDLFNAVKLAKKFEFSQLEETTNKRLQEVIAIISEDKSVEKDQSSLIGRFKQVVKRLVSISPSQPYKDIETDVHGVLIITNHGTTVFSQYLSDRLQSEPALISGLISAVSSFITEIASGKGFLKSIMHDDMSLILEPLADYIIVCIASEETFTVRERTRKLAQENQKVLEEAADTIGNGEIPRTLEEKLESSITELYVSN